MHDSSAVISSGTIDIVLGSHLFGSPDKFNWVGLICTACSCHKNYLNNISESPPPIRDMLEML